MLFTLSAALSLEFVTSFVLSTAKSFEYFNVNCNAIWIYHFFLWCPLWFETFTASMMSTFMYFNLSIFSMLSIVISVVFITSFHAVNCYIIWIWHCFLCCPLPCLKFSLVSMLVTPMSFMKLKDFAHLNKNPAAKILFKIIHF